MRPFHVSSIISAVALAACGGSASPTNAIDAVNSVDFANTAATANAMSADAAPSAAPTQTSWAGEYGGDTDGGSSMATIKTTDQPDRYSVDMSAFGEGGCGGNAQGGKGVATGNTLVATFAFDGGGVCRVRFTRNGEAVKVAYDSGDGCLGMTGASCTMQGVYTRTAPSKAKTTNATLPVSGATLIGAWVDPDGGCETDSGLFLNKDGTWSRNGHTGPWSLTGSRLKLVTTQLIIEGETDMQSVNPPTAESYTVTSPLSGRIILTGPDGGIENYMRCR